MNLRSHESDNGAHNPIRSRHIPHNSFFGRLFHAIESDCPICFSESTYFSMVSQSIIIWASTMVILLVTTNAFLPVQTPLMQKHPLATCTQSTSSPHTTTLFLASTSRPATFNRKPQDSTSTSTSVDNRALNQAIVAAESVSDVLHILQRTPGAFTNYKILNCINYSTALHRLARHASANEQERAALLADYKFALFLVRFSEALVAHDFYARELSNVAWALAKLKFVPPTAVVGTGGILDLQETARLVQTAVVANAGQQTQSATTTSSSSSWIPALSRLAGYMLDVIADKVLVMQCPENGPRQDSFQMQEYANVLWAFATAKRTKEQLFATLCPKMIQQQQLFNNKTAITTSIRQRTNNKHNKITGELRPQEWSNTIWAMATAQYYDAAFFNYVADLLEEYPDFARTFKGQERSNTLWAVATCLSNQQQQPLEPSDAAVALRIVRVLCQTMVPADMRSQEISNTAWALATIGFGLPADVSNAQKNHYMVLPSNDAPGDRAVLNRTLTGLLRASEPILFKFRSQELNNFAWALARLAPTEQEHLIQIGNHLCHPRRTVASQDIGTTLWSMASVGAYDAQLYKRLIQRLSVAQWTRAKPQELSNIVWAMARAEMELGDDQDAFDTSLLVLYTSKRPPAPQDPVVVVFGIVAQELLRRPFDFKPQEVKDVLWSFSKIGIRHPALFKFVAQHLVTRGMDDFSPQGLGNLAWAYARQAQLAGETSQRRATKLTQTSGRLAVYTSSNLDLGEELLQALFRCIAETDLRVHDNLKQLKPQDLANTLWAFAVLGLLHTELMEKAKLELHRRTLLALKGQAPVLSVFKGQELANAIWALATLNIPATELMDSMASYLTMVCQDNQGELTTLSIAKLFRRQELANIAWSCAVFGCYPPELMRLMYIGLVGVDGQDPESMNSIYQDFGMQHQAITTLIYVQAAMDLAGSAGDLSLPVRFPEGWQQNASLQNEFTLENIELTLSSSAIQRAVSAAFHRVGFEHVDEHVITMEDMVDTYGIRLPRSPMEILSIDVANVKDRIAIEVDGPAHYISKIDETDCTGETNVMSRVVNGKLEYHFQWDGSKQQTNGPTSLKQRLLASLGWNCIHVPFWEWYALNGDAAAEGEYCRALLR
jgi:hypothetical protein